MSQQSILTILGSDQSRAFFTKYGIRHLMLTGSYATNTMTKESDIDLIYEQDPDTEIGWEISDIRRYIEKKCKKSVDLMEKNYLHPTLKSSLLSHCVSIF